jgi:Uncharacterized conserved protein (DUF2075)
MGSGAGGGMTPARPGGLVLPNVGIFGGAGSGKSTLAKTLIKELAPRFEFVIIVNNSEELGEFAYKREYVNVSMAEQAWNVDALEKFVRYWKRVHFEVAAARPVAFMDALAQVMRRLGKFQAQHGTVLFVCDEAHKFMSKAVFSKSQNVQAIDLELRKYGVCPVKITPRISSTSQDALAHDSLTQCRQIFLCPMNADVDMQAAERLGFPNPGGLLYPDPLKGLPGEYYAKDSQRGTLWAVMRSPDGGRVGRFVSGMRPDVTPYLEQLKGAA